MLLEDGWSELKKNKFAFPYLCKTEIVIIYFLHADPTSPGGVAYERYDYHLPDFVSLVENLDYLKIVSRSLAPTGKAAISRLFCKAWEEEGWVYWKVEGTVWWTRARSSPLTNRFA